MKDFDKERAVRQQGDREFKIGGKPFLYRASVAPEALQRWTAFTSKTELATARLNAAKAELSMVVAQSVVPDREKLIAEDLSVAAQHAAEVARLTREIAERTGEVEQAEHDSDVISLIDETITAMIEPSDHEKWEAVRSPNAEFPLDLADLQELLQWLMEQVVNRPTGPQSSSSSGRGKSGTGSTGVSSSTASPAA